MERLTEIYTYNGKPEISVDSEKNGISCSNFCMNCGKADCEDIRKALFKLAEYEDLEEQGKLLKLPCNIGHLVYEPYQFMGEGAWEIDVRKIKLEDLGKIGKTVFLTWEEAEAALKKLYVAEKPESEG